MKSVLLKCKKKAKLMVEMKDPVVMVGGRRKGYVEVMFDHAGYEHLGFTRHLEKLLGNITGNVSIKIRGRRRNELESLMEENETCESTQVLENDVHCNIIVNKRMDQNANHDEMDLKAGTQTKKTR